MAAAGTTKVVEGPALDVPGMTVGRANGDGSYSLTLAEWERVRGMVLWNEQYEVRVVLTPTGEGG